VCLPVGRRHVRRAVHHPCVSSRTWNGHDIPDEADLETLKRMLEGDAPAPWLAFAALAARRDPAALKLIVEQCGNVDPDKRRSAIEAIGTSPIGVQAIEYVRLALDDPAPPVVDAAIMAIARLRDEKSRPRLNALLKGSNPYYRGYALLALGDMWSDAEFEPVLEIARHDRDERNRKNASSILRAHPLDWRQLVALWCESELPREREWVCELIGERGDATDRALLELLRRDPNGHVRQRAEEALLALEART
jgi:HEAT repeat protein